MRRALLVSILGACYTSAPAPPAPAPVARPAPRAAAISPDEALCCCTFASAEAEDFPDVNKWEAHAPSCVRGAGGRIPGRCIAWSWCGYAPGTEPKLAQRPDLRPKPPLSASGECCCAHAAAGAEELEVTHPDACAAAPMSQCIDAGFCERDP